MKFLEKIKNHPSNYHGTAITIEGNNILKMIHPSVAKGNVLK